jgi:hypothetical protein
MGAVHFDGRAWSYQRLDASAEFRAMDGSAANNVWAYGVSLLDGARVLTHFDGTRWDTVPPPTTPRRLTRIAVSRTQVFMLEESESESDTLVVHVWNGRSWTRERLPFSFVVAGMRIVGTEPWIAGYAYFDPRPTTRNQHGVLLRRVAGRWVSTWTGRSSTDPVIGAASWTSFDAVGDRALLYGEDASGASRMLVRRGAAAWRRVETPASLPDGAYVSNAFLLGDGSPVARYQGRSRAGFLRHNGTAWEPFAASVTPAVFPDRPRLTLGVINWSPPGAGSAYTLVEPRMVAMMTAAETRVVAAAWCLGMPGGSTVDHGFGAAADANICTAITASAGAAPAAAAPTGVPGAPGAAPSGKRKTPPAGLPRPARP